jgi:NAD(P)-dependent dehydrogenase (short-subunit alcohol dehydrogenase family)
MSSPLSAFPWHEKVALITGGAGGMGIAISVLLRSLGSKIAIVDVSPAALSRMKEQFPNDQNILLLNADITKPDNCEKAVNDTVATFGRLDLLINAAGLWVEGPSDTMTESDYDRIMNVNLKGAFFMIKYSIKYLETVKGQVINISSDAGIKGEGNASIYSASKGGLILLTKSLAIELAEKGIRVNAICPADVETPMLTYQANTYSPSDPESYYNNLKKNYPQGKNTRFIRPEEIALFIKSIAEIECITGSLTHLLNSFTYSLTTQVQN